MFEASRSPLNPCASFYAVKSQHQPHQSRDSGFVLRATQSSTPLTELSAKLPLLVWTTYVRYPHDAIIA